MNEPIKYNPKGDSELQDLLMDCYVDTGLFAQTFFPERFYAEFSPLHYEMFELIDSDEPYVCIAAPRGIGKTSLVGLALTAKNILYRDTNFLLYVSLSATSAELQTDNLKIELVSNQMVQKVFGHIATKSASGLGDQFSKKAWIARLAPNEIGTLVLPRGSGQQVRGLLFRNERPSIFVIDDLEDPETIENEEVRRKRKAWFYADLLKARSRVKKGWRFFYIDTLKHEDSLLQHLLDAPQWVSIRQELCDDDFNSNAPTFISTEEVKLEAQQHRDDGMMDVFYREYRNIPISLEDAAFRGDRFKYYQEGVNELIITEKHPDHGTVDKPKKLPMSNLINVVICDPAKTKNMKSADSAVVGWAADRSSKMLFFRDCVSGKMYPDELYDEMFGMVNRLKAYALAVEVTSLHQFISQPIKNEMRVRGIFCQYVELNAQQKKEERVKWLAPYYRQGYIYHNPNICQKLESQLIGYPRSRLWDVMDASAYIVKLLDELEIFFEPDGFDPDGDDDMSELDNERPLSGWRIAS